LKLDISVVAAWLGKSKGKWYDDKKSWESGLSDIGAWLSKFRQI
jgi:hypothetical protein